MWGGMVWGGYMWVVVVVDLYVNHCSTKHTYKHATQHLLPRRSQEPYDKTEGLKENMSAALIQLFSPCQYVAAEGGIIGNTKSYLLWARPQSVRAIVPRKRERIKWKRAISTARLPSGQRVEETGGRC